MSQAAKKKAIYHQSGGQKPVELVVVKTHDNKTVDLADAKGTVKVTNCVVLEKDAEAKPGSCSITK